MKHIPVILLFLFIGVFPYEIVAQSTQDQLKQIRSGVIEKIDGQDFYIHTIKRGQTLYMISKAYGVEVNDIIRENPGVKEGIRADQKLRIPVPGQKKTPAPKEKANPGKETSTKAREVLPKTDSVPIAELPCGKDATTKKAEYRVALMLPLYLSGVDQIDVANPDAKIAGNIKSFQFLPYYEGFRMALDSLEKLGMKIRLYVYDLDKDTARTRQVLKKPEMKSMDLIFGLLYHQNFQIVAAFAKKNKINLVNPVSERNELIAANPYIFKVQPSQNYQVRQLAEYMARTFRDGQVLIIRNGQYGDLAVFDQLKKECQDHDLQVKIVDGQSSAIGLYSKGKANFVVAFSDNQAYTLDLLRGMYKLRNEYDLTLVGLPDWSDMDGLENEYLVALKTHMMSASFIDYDNSSVRQFVRQYQDIYKSDPGLLAFEGFDQAFYFLSALQTYGTNIGRCIGELKMPLMQSRLDFVQSKGNGFENRQWTILKFENYKMVAVD
jgi:ABC-type branched-subunit amino acid transport system substrate-binding protein